MKHIIIILISFSLLLISCSSYQVTLTMRDGAKIESELLSVRDSSIVIQEKGGAPIAIRNEDVNHVFRKAPSPVGSMAGFGVLFAIMGFGTGVVFTPLTGCGGDCPQGMSIMLTGAAIGAGIGSLVGFIAAPNDKTFYLNDPQQRDELIDYSKYYPEEPGELKKIK